jgi:F-type H+-transporting ATPase subunit b
MLRSSLQRAIPSLMVAAMLFATKVSWAADDGLPQARTEYYVGQLFWLTVSFLLLYLLLSKLALPRIAVVQKQRHDIRELDLTAAAQANDQAKALLEASQKKILTARSEAQAKLEAIIKAAQEHSQHQQDEQRRQLMASQEIAQQQIETMRQAALGKVHEGAQDVTQVMIKILTGTAPAREQVEQIVMHARSGAIK